MIKVSPPHVVDPHARSSRPTPAGPRATQAVLDGAKAHGHDHRRPVAATGGARAGRRRVRAARRPGRAARSATERAAGPEHAPNGIPSHPREVPSKPLRSPTVTVYVAEEFTPDEADILRRYFTNLDGPVFALVNLPEVVKGALFARYSRSPKSLRRLFLDEFVGELDITGDATIDATVGLRRAEELYDRVFFEYGDDSVAQLGGVHLACEQASNLLTKVLEWGRLMAYLEQSTRYIAYDARLGGRYRYYRDPDVLQSPLGTRYVGDMDRLFDTYAELLPPLQDFFREQFPKDAERLRLRVPPGHPGQGVRRAPGHPAGRVAVERRHLRHRPGLRAAAAAHAGPPAARGPHLRRPDARASCARSSRRSSSGSTSTTAAWRGAPTSAATATAMDDVAARLFPADDARPSPPRSVTPGRLRPRRRGQARRRRCSTRTRHLPEAPDRAPGPGHDGRRAARRRCGPTSATAANRRHKPGRALERIDYRFDVARRLRRLPRPPAPPHADHRVAAALAPATASPGPRRSTPAGEPAARSTAPWTARPRSTTPWSSAFPAQAAVRRVPGLQGALRHADERPRGDAPHRAAHRPRRATPPTGWSPRRCTASSPRRPATAPSPR